MRHDARLALGTIGGLLALPPPPAYSQPELATAIVSGHIVDYAGCPIVDANLTLMADVMPPGPTDRYVQRTRSDAQGAFSFAPMPSGRLYWIPYAWGAGSSKTSVTLGPSGNYVAVRTPPPSPIDIVDFVFRIVDLDNEPVREARITWHRLLGGVESDCVTGATTTADGRAVAPSVPPGRYHVTVEANGFAPFSIDTSHGWGSGVLAAQLLAEDEARKARKSSAVIISCGGPAPPATIRALVAYAEAIVVARVVGASLESDSSAAGWPIVRTVYDIQPLEIIKGSALLTPTAASRRLRTPPESSSSTTKSWLEANAWQRNQATCT